MKILAISCSPRRKGNTVAMLGETLEAAEAAGAEVELYSVAGKDIQPCEPPRLCWRLQPLRGWGHDNIKEVSS